MINPEKDKEIKELIQELNNATPEEIKQMIRDSKASPLISDPNVCRYEGDEDFLPAQVLEVYLNLLPRRYSNFRIVESYFPPSSFFQEKDREIELLEQSQLIDLSFVLPSPPDKEESLCPYPKDYPSATTYSDSNGDEKPLFFGELKELREGLKKEKDFSFSFKTEAFRCHGIGQTCGRTATNVFICEVPKFSAPRDIFPLKVEVFLCDECARHIKGDQPRDVSIGFKSSFSEDDLKKAEIGKIIALIKARAEKIKKVLGATYDALPPTASHLDRIEVLLDRITQIAGKTLRFRNFTSKSDKDFYFDNAASCGLQAINFALQGSEDLARFYAIRAGQYVNDYLLLCEGFDDK